MYTRQRTCRYCSAPTEFCRPVHRNDRRRANCGLVLDACLQKNNLPFIASMVAYWLIALPLGYYLGIMEFRQRIGRCSGLLGRHHCRRWRGLRHDRYQTNRSFEAALTQRFCRGSLAT